MQYLSLCEREISSQILQLLNQYAVSLINSRELSQTHRWGISSIKNKDYVYCHNISKKDLWFQEHRDPWKNRLLQFSSRMNNILQQYRTDCK